MKVRLVFEYYTDEQGTLYDYLSLAASELERKLQEADSMDDVAEVFLRMYVGESRQW